MRFKCEKCEREFAEDIAAKLPRGCCEGWRLLVIRPDSYPGSKAEQIERIVLDCVVEIVGEPAAANLAKHADSYLSQRAAINKAINAATKVLYGDEQPGQPAVYHPTREDFAALSKNAQDAVTWLWSDRADGLTMPAARLRIRLDFGEEVEAELLKFFKVKLVEIHDTFSEPLVPGRAPANKTEGTFFKEDVEALLRRYSTLSVYETLGALRVVEANLLERLGRVGGAA